MKTSSELKVPKGVFFSQQPVFYRPDKAESSRATHQSEGMSEPPAPSTSPGLPNSWPVAGSDKPANKTYCFCSHRGAELICHSRDSWVTAFASLFVQHGAAWLHLGLSSEVVEGCSHFLCHLLCFYLWSECVHALSLHSPPSPFLKDRPHIFRLNLLM